MKASKPLASAVAAAAVVGAIGLAYAQTPDPGTQPATPADTSSQTMQNQGTTSPATSPGMSTESPIERPAQADRN
ncbi:hypothetical protein [Polaromonas sp. JS666]|uniref:hypothetical protein n=1 Tax=Polaromonas sp. (strain JS666 / ATCC BAA-500) TaxID=296591 RepID=UPI000046493B|nr:hypothetical protein [Polaromonas sp. JS666]